MDDAQLDEYRRTWTSDVPASRDMRYQTESRRAGSNMPLKFQTSSVRMLPGTPRALEKFREKLITGHGILAMSVLRFYMGSGNIVRSQLQESFTLMEVDMDRSEFNQVFVFIF